MAKYYSVKVPIKPYLKKYVHRLYGNELFANRSTALGAFLCLSLEKNVYENRNPTRQEKKILFTDTLQFYINEWQFAGIGYDVPPASVVIINSFIDSLFSESLYQYCTNHSGEASHRYKGYNKAYYKFCIDYGLEPDVDITMDALKKKEYRYREHLKKKAINTPPPGKLF